MSLESMVSLLRAAVIPTIIVFGLIFLFFSARLVIQRMGFGADPISTTRSFLKTFASRGFSEIWSRQLSPQLKEKLCGEGFADPAFTPEGVERLAGFYERHQVAFPSAEFTLFSVHKVPIGDQHRELLMVRGIGQDSTRGVVVWLSRSTLSSGGWRVDDLYVQPPKGKRPPPDSLTLSGKVPKRGFMKAAQSADQGAMESAIAEDQFTELPEENSLLGVEEPSSAEQSTPRPAELNAQGSGSSRPRVVSQSTQKKGEKVTVVKL